MMEEETPQVITYEHGVSVCSVIDVKMAEPQVLEILNESWTPRNSWCEEDGRDSHDSGYITPDSVRSTETTPRDFQQCWKLYKAGQASSLTDDEIIELIDQEVMPAYKLESTLKDSSRAVQIRRALHTQTNSVSKVPERTLDGLPWEHFDYSGVTGRCAENVVGYIPIPVGTAGPLNINGVSTYIPMATTEGALIASTSRGCKALNASGGVFTQLLDDAMTRAPVVRFNTIEKAARAKRFIDLDTTQAHLKHIFSLTTRHGRLVEVTVRMAGPYLYLRFSARTGNAMGMNMLSKGCDAILNDLITHFPDMRVISISGNYCTDKKPSAINWIQGRGKSVVAECVLTKEVLEAVLKTTAEAMVELNMSKNLVGSALAGTATGGFNAHAANIVAAVFLATGQDPAQVSTSSNCLTMMEKTDDDSLHITVTMPSIEVGTVGGGTELAAQSTILKLMGCGDASDGNSAVRLASAIAAAVLAGELSLCSALTSGDLVSSHMKMNRKSPS
nr:putative 3-hydroxy-3-methylglutaryl-coenzyme A reductase [Phoma sp.]